MSFEVVDIETQDNSQDIKIPAKFRIHDDKVYMKKVGNAIYIIPYHDAWKTMIDATDEFSDDFMNERNQASDQQQRENLD